jgi:hypothetical protein
MNQQFGNAFVERTVGAALLALAFGALGGVLCAQNVAAPTKVPDLSGFWERHDDVGGGNFGGILEKIVPKASLTPEVLKANQETAARQAQGEVVAFGSKWCLSNLYPFFMQHSAAWDLFQTQTEIMQAAEVHTFPRHIYLDGRKHPSPALLVSSINGHSVGHWEGETLVVDTIGFSGGGGTPGGGRVGKDTHLTERFKLIEGGKKLSVVFTWEDPSIYLKPHTYGLEYYKSDPGTYAYEETCHADDPKQSGSVVAPGQKYAQ